MYRIIGASRHVMFVSNVLLSNAVINIYVFYILNITKYIKSINLYIYIYIYIYMTFFCNVT